MSFCTGKEIIELDLKNMLMKNPPIDDECEMDILALQKYAQKMCTLLIKIK